MLDLIFLAYLTYLLQEIKLCTQGDWYLFIQKTLKTSQDSGLSPKTTQKKSKPTSIYQAQTLIGYNGDKQ